MKRLLVATTNAGKVAELTEMLGPLGVELCGLDAFPDVVAAEEAGATFAENAEQKARHYARATGLPTLADDSGLEVDALDGAPGVRSARFAGDEAGDAANNALLLERLAGVTDRRARFRCVVSLVEGDGPALSAGGTCEGRILEEPRGDGGFGYDPLFVPDAGDGRTFAELSRADKRGLSHRGRALAALLALLKARARTSARGDAR
ncbi:MAG: RdgB/HAM1 family non-canonical purine NTP pyrophosphatase [Planctomycetes bacterium]|nr:RdgB/HAM1 family non-canonical purine NTP pyrophosphatase [Planctomycetota bacterium]